MKNRLRSLSVNEVDHEEASGILGDVFRESNVYLGGSSFGKGLKTAARYYLHERMAKAPRPLHLDYPGAANLDPACEQTPLEESFYVVDLGLYLRYTNGDASSHVLNLFTPSSVILTHM